MSYPTILEVVPGSPAAVADIAVGDELLAVNDVRPADVIEYQQLVDGADPEFTLRRNGRDRDVTVVKDAGRPVGLRLDSSIFDRVQTCDNHCEFCFIYQLPPGMRKSLYLKDDDYRLSFLYGNFTTLTRFTELDLARVVEERLGPLYVSLHATDPDVRSRMLRNPKGATSLRWLRALLDHGITVHGQVVLCPSINNGPVLGRTCAEVLVRFPEIASVGIVPLGLSRFNTETALTVHTRAEAARDLDIIEFWREEALRRLGHRMFHAADELYIVAGRDMPASEEYDGFPQHENGIGMVRAFDDELGRLESGVVADPLVVTGEWRHLPGAPATGYRAERSLGGAVPAGDGPAVIVTGGYAHAVLEPMVPRLSSLTGRPIRILPVPNRFFGGNVAVAGLIVGADVGVALAADAAPAAVYLLPNVALAGDLFLDGASLGDVAVQAAAPVVAIEPTAAALVAALRAGAVRGADRE